MVVREPFAVTRNACKLCAPLGACLAFRGIEGAAPFLHGSQGCATYIRRYVISHFREPMDVAVSGFAEADTVFGGGRNLRDGLNNVARQYHPKLIGVATTCLPETIGDDLSLLLHGFTPEGEAPPAIVRASTPSYRGTHVDGFHAAIFAAVEQLTQACEKHEGINVFPGMCSPADIRYLKEVFAGFGLQAAILPDYSETLDGPQLDEYQKVPSGGLPVEAIRRMGGARMSLEFGRTLGHQKTAAQLLQDKFGVPRKTLGWPVGIRETDRFFAALEELSGRQTPEAHVKERGRLVDAYVDAHKYIFGRRAIVFGEEDLVVALTAFLTETGVEPVLCASGGESGRMAEALRAVAGEAADAISIRQGADFMSMGEEAAALKPDLMIGSSKGYSLARQMEIPLIRCGFPVHDRIGGQRILHMGYRGAQQLFDSLVNTLLERAQNSSPVGYSYL